MVLFWTYLDRVVQILAVLVLLTIWLQKLGFNTNVADRLKKTRVGKFITIIVRAGNPAARFNDETFEDNAQILADNTKLILEQGKKIKEEINMSKLKVLREKVLWTILGNKKLITTYVVVALFVLDSIFGWSKTYNLPPDTWYYLGALVVFLVLWAAGGEGWTSATTNKLRNEAMSAKKQVKSESKKWQQKLDEINIKIDNILAEKVDGIIPPHLKQRYDELTKSKALYQKKLDELLAQMSGEEVL